ncbi:MAG: 8-amino-7-oxononanoate synthase [Tenericutes bacterium HGW-Tenericutes-4]|nr:MAG: 8-amino-7-oxononanoate synthase [Tenericutes bacterium HGW-Tenericutes-4]
MDIFEKTKHMDQLKKVKKQGIYPYFHALGSGQDTEVVMEGHNTIMIGSNNYLGLTSHPEVIKAGVDAIKKYGSGCSGSRFLNGTLDIHLKLEKELAEFLNKEACLTFSTGFQSNLGIISAIAGRNDYIIGDKENHASIYDACRLSYAKLLRYEHSNMQELEDCLKSVPDGFGKLIVTDGVFSMGGDLCNLPDIVRLAKQYNARVMVDDAHGLGVLGKGGCGTASYFNLEHEVDIIMGTFSKSLASLGGYMVASKDVVEFVKHTSRPFIFSASITPASVACARTALQILKREPERVTNLQQITNYVRSGLIKRGVDIQNSFAPIIPINTYEDERTFVICKILLQNGVYVNPVISPAVPVGHAILRTSYTATHTKEQMDKAMDIVVLSIKQADELLLKMKNDIKA